jgi:hypothetical protein
MTSDSLERARSVAISCSVLFMANEVTDGIGSSFITEAMVIRRSTVESSGNRFAGPSAGSEKRNQTRGPFGASMRREATDAVGIVEVEDWSTERPPSTGDVSWRG